MATLTKEMLGNCSLRWSNVSSICTPRRSAIVIWNLKTSLWTLRRALRWRSLTSGSAISGKMTCGLSWKHKRRTNWLALPTISLQKYWPSTTTRGAISGQQEWSSTSWQLLPHPSMGKQTDKSWKVSKLWSTPSTVRHKIDSSWSGPPNSRN